MVISLMKSGTHLIQELMTSLGYAIYGQSRTPPEVLPQVTGDEARRIDEIVHGARAADETSGQSAWEALGWAWQSRLGLPLVNRYGSEIAQGSEVTKALENTTTRFSDTPAGTCWILPELDVSKVDGQFIQEWVDTGVPRILYVYRDPRDALISMINFLLGKTGKGFGNFADFQVHSAILKSLPDMAARIRYALTVRDFPGRGDIERMEWLLHHPAVYAVSFEDLVGPRGGGDLEAQHRAVAGILAHLEVGDVAPANAAQQLFSADSFTFHKGQIGAWRTEFDTITARLADDVMLRGLVNYGYDLSEASIAARMSPVDVLVAQPRPEPVATPATPHTAPIDADEPGLPHPWSAPRINAALESIRAAGEIPGIGLLWELCVHQEFDRSKAVPAIIDWLGPDTTQRILDCACGSGFPALDLAAHGYDVVAADGSPEMLAYFRRNAELDGIDLTAQLILWEDLPATFTAEFDVVMCRGGGNFLYAGTWDEEGTPDRRQMEIALKNFVSCIKPGGRLYIDISQEADLNRTEPNTDRTPPTAVGSHVVALSQTVTPDPAAGVREWVSDLTVDGQRVSFRRTSHWLSHEEFLSLLTEAGMADMQPLDIPGEAYAVYVGTKAMT